MQKGAPLGQGVFVLAATFIVLTGIDVAVPVLTLISLGAAVCILILVPIYVVGGLGCSHSFRGSWLCGPPARG